MPTAIRSAGPITPRRWSRRALAAWGLAMCVSVGPTLALTRVVPVPWKLGVPTVLGLAVFFTYHSEWWRRRWRRATMVQLTVLIIAGLAVVALQERGRAPRCGASRQVRLG